MFGFIFKSSFFFLVKIFSSFSLLRFSFGNEKIVLILNGLKSLFKLSDSFLLSFISLFILLSKILRPIKLYSKFKFWKFFISEDFFEEFININSFLKGEINCFLYNFELKFKGRKFKSLSTLDLKK